MTMHTDTKKATHAERVRQMRRHCAYLLRQVATLEAAADEHRAAPLATLEALESAADALQSACALWDAPELDA
jgi:tRNA-dihydrouridine synthase